MGHVIVGLNMNTSSERQRLLSQQVRSSRQPLTFQGDQRKANPDTRIAFWRQICSSIKATLAV